MRACQQPGDLRTTLASPAGARTVDSRCRSAPFLINTAAVNACDFYRTLCNEPPATQQEPSTQMDVQMFNLSRFEYVQLFKKNNKKREQI